MKNLKTVTSSAITVTCCIASCFTSGCKRGSTGSPNIVLIMMDDMGYGDIGITGATQYETPNLDRLASEDIFYNYFYGTQHIWDIVIKVLSIRMNDKV